LKCPECDNELKKIQGSCGIVGEIRLQHHACKIRGCKAFDKLWFKSIKTGEAVDPAQTIKNLDDLKKC